MTATADWPTCGRSFECRGARVEGFDSCLADLNPNELKIFLNRLRPGDDLDARGTTISAELFASLMEAVPRFGNLNFKNAQFDGVESLGPVDAHRLVLDGARFAQRVVIEVHATYLTCVETRFDDGATIRASDAEIIAERTYFGATSSITSNSRIRSSALERAEAKPTIWWPKLISLRGTDVSNLVIVDVDLSPCLFAGTHRLDQLRLEGDCWFASPPGGWKGVRRNVLAEDYLERLGWDEHPLAKDADIPVERVIGLYRSLRKALEDSKNEAGAGDFYYGEMDARRRYWGTPWAERKILTAYWLLSGYGQRAVRAVAALGVLVAIVCILLFTVGWPGGVDWSWARVDQSLRIGMGAVVFREAGQTLTSAGGWTVMVARFAGPVLLALALLAIRARVKR